MTPLLKCYSVTLPNPVSFISGDIIRVSIKIPMNIFGQKYGYSLENLDDSVNGKSAGLRLKSSTGCLDVNTELKIDQFCGWIIIKLEHVVDSTEEICNLCEISYSICFDPVKLKVLYGQCNEHSEENVEFPIETCLELEAYDDDSGSL